MSSVTNALHVHQAYRRIGDQYASVEKTIQELGRPEIGKAQLEGLLTRFNVMMPDQAFEKFWSTITIADAPSVPVDEFLSRVRPMTKTPLQPAGTQKKCKPSEAGTKVVKKNLFYVDPANPRPVPVWDNEWRQEADNRLREPIMSGIMRGVYYTYNTYSPSARTPRQEMDLKLQKPITTLTVEGRFYGDAQRDQSDRERKRLEERRNKTAHISRNRKVVSYFSTLMAEQKTALKTARSYDLATPRSFRQTPRWQDSVGAPWPPFTPRATESEGNQALVRQSYNQGSQTDRGMLKEDAGTQDNLTAGGLPVQTSRPQTSAVDSLRVPQPKTPRLLLRQAMEQVKVGP